MGEGLQPTPCRGHRGRQQDRARCGELCDMAQSPQPQNPYETEPLPVGRTAGRKGLRQCHHTLCSPGPLITKVNQAFSLHANGWKQLTLQFFLGSTTITLSIPGMGTCCLTCCLEVLRTSPCLHRIALLLPTADLGKYSLCPSLQISKGFASTCCGFSFVISKNVFQLLSVQFQACSLYAML